MFTIIKLLKAAIYYGLYYSFKTGQFLVSIAKLLFEHLITVFNILTDVIFILSESFRIFLQDFLQVLKLILEIVSDVCQAFEESSSKTLQGIDNIVEQITVFIYTICKFCCDSLELVQKTTERVFIICKHLIISIGLAVWYAVTFIPLSIWNLIKGINKFFEEIHRSAFDSTIEIGECLKNCLKNIYNFLTDIPAESVIGLLVAAALIYIFTQFYVIIFSYFYRQIRCTLQNIYRKFRRRPTQISHSRSSRAVPRRRPQLRRELAVNQTSKEEQADERCCVICQEHLKCILTLPCRHVCMCSECNSRLQLYNNTCPICRNDIESTMEIFV